MEQGGRFVAVVPAKWPDKNGVKACQSCGKSFGVFDKKGNCYGCGKVCCVQCTAVQIQIPQYPDGPKAACGTCMTVNDNVRRQQENAIERCTILSDTVDEQSRMLSSLQEKAEGMRSENEKMLAVHSQLNEEIKRLQQSLQVARMAAAVVSEPAASPSRQKDSPPPASAESKEVDAKVAKLEVLEADVDKKLKLLEGKEAAVTEARKKNTSDAVKLNQQREAIQALDRQWRQTAMNAIAGDIASALADLHELALSACLSTLGMVTLPSPLPTVQQSEAVELRQEEIAHLRQSLADITAEHAAQSSKHEQARKEHEERIYEMDAAAAQLKTDLAVRVQSEQRLSEELKAGQGIATALSKEISTLQGQLQQSATAVDDATSRLTVLSSDKATMQEEIAQLTQKLKLSTTAEGATAAELANLNVLVSDLKREAERSSAKMTEDLEQCRALHQKEIDSLRSENSAAASSWSAEAEKQRVELTASHEAAAARFQEDELKMLSTISTLQAKVDATQAKLDTTQAKLDDMKRELDEARLELATSRDAVKLTEAEVAKTKAELAAATEQSAALLKGRDEKVTALERTVREANEEVARERAAASSLAAAGGSASEVQAQLQARLLSAERDLAAAAKARDELQTSLAELKSADEAKRSELVVLTAQLGESSKSREELEAEVAALRLASEKLTTQLGEVKADGERRINEVMSQHEKALSEAKLAAEKSQKAAEAAQTEVEESATRHDAERARQAIEISNLCLKSNDDSAAASRVIQSLEGTVAEGRAKMASLEEALADQRQQTQSAQADLADLLAKQQRQQMNDEEQKPSLSQRKTSFARIANRSRGPSPPSTDSFAYQLWSLLKRKVPVGASPDEAEARRVLFGQFNKAGAEVVSCDAVLYGCSKILRLDSLTDNLDDLVARAVSFAACPRSEVMPGAEFLLLLSYIYNYFELWTVFAEHVQSTATAVERLEKPIFLRAAVPLIEDWGLKLSSPEATFDALDADKDGYVLLDDLADWAIKQNSDWATRTERCDTTPAKAAPTPRRVWADESKMLGTISTLQAKLDDMKRELDEARLELATSRDAVKLTEAEVAKTKAELAAATEQSAALLKGRDEKVTALERTVREANEEVARERAAASSLAAAGGSASEVQAQLQARLLSAERDLAAAAKARDELQTSLAELKSADEAKRSELVVLTAQLGESSKSREELEAEVAALRLASEKLTTQLGEVKADGERRINEVMSQHEKALSEAKLAAEKSQKAAEAAQTEVKTLIKIAEQKQQSPEKNDPTTSKAVFNPDKAASPPRSETVQEELARYKAAVKRDAHRLNEAGAVAAELKRSKEVLETQSKELEATRLKLKKAEKASHLLEARLSASENRRAASIGVAASSLASLQDYIEQVFAATVDAFFTQTAVTMEAAQHDLQHRRDTAKKSATMLERASESMKSLRLDLKRRAEELDAQEARVQEQQVLAAEAASENKVTRERLANLARELHRVAHELQGREEGIKNAEAQKKMQQTQPS